MSDSFLSRWARRKVAVRSAERQEQPVAPDTTGGETLDSAAPSGEAEIRTDGGPDAVTDDWLARLPSLDALTPDADLTAFLQAGVPTALRNAALRRMWSLDPAIRDFVSEAREYAYDWNTPGGVPGTGALLPIDDVKAMLKRVVDGVPVADEEAPETEVQETKAPEAAAESREAPAAPAVADSPEFEAIARFEEATPPTADLPPHVAGLPDDHAETGRSAPVRPRLRRHGGAMPS